MELQEIKELYEQGCSLSELGRKYNCCNTTIKKKLVAAGVPIRTRAQQNYFSNKKRKKAVNENYFSTIDTVNKAWVLGFLMADGSVRKDRNEIRINLSAVDVEILEKIKEEMNIERDIVTEITNQGYSIATLSWTSEQQKKDLAKFGIVPNKTYLPLHLPKLNNDSLILAFILGYFDGDGCFTFTDKYCRFRIVSYRNELLQEIGNFLKEKYQIKYSISQDNRKLYELSISSIKVMEEMYSLNSIRLDRKYQKYLEYINQETIISLKR